jgi:hypothetical protein
MPALSKVIGSSARRARCRVAGSFDGATYRMRFPVGCIGSPERVRFTAYVQLYNDTADGIIGGE